ncbi:MAG TPA: bifunctional YncE family protein/alkaline phosphatase family protein [Tepidisphaeraceae bacterium]|jgi:YVTN family beta-propeller protein
MTVNHRRYGWACIASCALAIGCSNNHPEERSNRNWAEQVTQFGPNGGAIVPTQQILTPAGSQVELPGLRPQAIALSPDGQLLITSGLTAELVVLDPSIGTIKQRVPLPPDSIKIDGSMQSARNLRPERGAQLSYTGLIFAPDGRHIYLSNVQGSVKVFDVAEDHQVTARGSISLPPTGLKSRPRDIPSGLATSADGQRLYVSLNVSNRLAEIDAATGKTLRTFDVGNAPFQVAITGGKAYISNWGGRRPDGNEPTGPIGKNGKVRVDPIRFIANEGSVSVVDLAEGKTLKEIQVGLHSSVLTTTSDGKFVVVANANSDTLSVIDTATDAVVETISTRYETSDPFGCSPNALTFDTTGKTLYVCNGTQNSIAVIDFNPGHSKLKGLIPTAWYPGAIAWDAPRNTFDVANIKGVGSGKRLAPGDPIKFNSHQNFGTLSLIPLPEKTALEKMTSQVLENCRRRDALAALRPPRPNIAPRPVPERVGEPSVFKHVVYIIKENRTYDQVLGDMKQGNGDESLCVFGEKFSPNQHKMSRDFVLLDNTYCVGINSAEGHQWTGAAFSTDYLERSYAGFPRSYPDGMEEKDADALAYAPTGFIWDNVLAHGKTLRDYGEFTISTSGWADKSRRGSPCFTDYYNDFVNPQGLIHIGSRPTIPSLANHMATQTVGWNLDIPDVLRAKLFIDELHGFEKACVMPDLSIICLPNDHTSGTKAGSATPGAQIADNDLAFGQIVEAISHSAFWKDTCILAIEDDPQAGWDHVSAFRTTAYVVSPYTKRGAVIHTNYNQPSLLRTIELILGLPPMNQLDAMSTPMFDCFRDTPDLRPFEAVAARVPLDEVNPPPQAIRDRQTRRFAEISAKLPLAQADKCPEDLLNRVIWNAQKGSRLDYPAKYAGKVDDDD